MYFQVCSNSTYPQHSGERYRTNGPLVIFYSTLGPLNHGVFSNAHMLTKENMRDPYTHTYTHSSVLTEMY